MQREYFQQSIDNELTDHTHLNQESPNKAWESVKETVNKVAGEGCGKVRPTSRQQWITTEILEKMARRRQMQRGSHEHKQLSREIKEACRVAKGTHFTELCKEIESLHQKHRNKLYQKIKELKVKKHQLQLGICDSSGKILHTGEEIKARWEQYIGKELYDGNRGTKPTLCIEPDLLHPISSVEVEETIRSLPKQKSPGVENLPAEFLQALSDTGIHLMTLLINRIYTTGIYPDDFLWSVFVPYQMQ